VLPRSDVLLPLELFSSFVVLRFLSWSFCPKEEPEVSAFPRVGRSLRSGFVYGRGTAKGSTSLFLCLAPFFWYISGAVRIEAGGRFLFWIDSLLPGGPTDSFPSLSPRLFLLEVVRLTSTPVPALEFSPDTYVSTSESSPYPLSFLKLTALVRVEANGWTSALDASPVQTFLLFGAAGWGVFANLRGSSGCFLRGRCPPVLENFLASVSVFSPNGCLQWRFFPSFFTALSSCVLFLLFLVLVGGIVLFSVPGQSFFSVLPRGVRCHYFSFFFFLLFISLLPPVFVSDVSSVFLKTTPPLKTAHSF